jgi:hypothetical protein
MHKEFLLRNLLENMKKMGRTGYGGSLENNGL